MQYGSNGYTKKSGPPQAFERSTQRSKSKRGVSVAAFQKMAAERSDDMAGCRPTRQVAKPLDSSIGGLTYSFPKSTLGFDPRVHL